MRESRRLGRKVEEFATRARAPRVCAPPPPPADAERDRDGRFARALAAADARAASRHTPSRARRECAGHQRPAPRTRRHSTAAGLRGVRAGRWCAWGAGTGHRPGRRHALQGRPGGGGRALPALTHRRVAVRARGHLGGRRWAAGRGRLAAAGWVRRAAQARELSGALRTAAGRRVRRGRQDAGQDAGERGRCERARDHGHGRPALLRRGPRPRLRDGRKGPWRAGAVGGGRARHAGLRAGGRREGVGRRAAGEGGGKGRGRGRR